MVRRATWIAFTWNQKEQPKNALLPVLGGQWPQRQEGAIKMRNGPTNLTSGSRVNSILLRAKQINCLIRVSTPCISPRLLLGGNANEKNSQIVWVDRSKNGQVSPKQKSSFWATDFYKNLQFLKPEGTLSKTGCDQTSLHDETAFFHLWCLWSQPLLQAPRSAPWPPVLPNGSGV